MAVQTQIQTRRGTAASWTSTNPTLAAGEIGFETDTNKFKIGTGSASWNSLSYASGTTAVTYLFNATAGQTTFSGADANSLTLAYTVGAEQVYLNGVLLVRTTDYTATNGTSIVLASGAVASDVLNVIAYSTMTLTDAYTQAQANATFSLNTSAFFAGKNKIINGDFGIWQRGTSFAGLVANAYTADRFLVNVSGATVTISQQTFTPGTAPVAGYEGRFFLRCQATVANDFVGMVQNIENVQTFAGQTITVSFWAKAAAANTLRVYVTQNFGSGGSTSVQTQGTPDLTLTTGWVRYSVTLAVPSIAGKTIGANNFLALQIYNPNNETSTIDLWGIQAEAGSVATAFQTATGTIQGELAACQRYYWRTSATGNYSPMGQGSANGPGGSYVTIQNPVQMRAISSVEYANLGLQEGGDALKAVTSVTIDQSDLAVVSLSVGASGGGLTQYRANRLLANNNSSAYLAISGEL